jgi:hypothetical protein
MFARIKRLYRLAPLATVLLGLSLVLLLVFSTRFVLHLRDPRPPADMAISGWMTPGFVAHSWHVPPEVMAAALDMERKPGKPKTLDQIAQDRGIPVEQLIQMIEASISDFRAREGVRK